MKGFGKGLALYCVVIFVAAALMLLIGFEEGSTQHGVAVSIGFAVAYIVAIRIDAIKPMLGVSILTCVMAVGNLALGEISGFFMLVSSVATLFLSIARIRNKR